MTVVAQMVFGKKISFGHISPITEFSVGEDSDNLKYQVLIADAAVETRHADFDQKSAIANLRRKSHFRSNQKVNCSALS